VFTVADRSVKANACFLKLDRFIILTVQLRFVTKTGSFATHPLLGHSTYVYLTQVRSVDFLQHTDC
jgi:hypothetical protein